MIQFYYNTILDPVYPIWYYKIGWGELKSPPNLILDYSSLDFVRTLPPKASQNLFKPSPSLGVAFLAVVQPINITATATTITIASNLYLRLHIICLMSRGVFPYISISPTTP